MITTLDPGRAHRTLNVEDNIVFSKVWDKKGFPVDLKMCLMGQSGNAEMRAAAGIDDEPLTALRPAVLWLNGSAWHCSEKNRMLAELTYLADAGYLVAIAEYRGSEQAQFPAQLLDVKTAVRFLRAHAEKYRIDPARIAVMGRSAGGHLAAWMAMDAPEYSGKGEWSQYSDQAHHHSPRGCRRSCASGNQPAVLYQPCPGGAGEAERPVHRPQRRPRHPGVLPAGDPAGDPCPAEKVPGQSS